MEDDTVNLTFSAIDYIIFVAMMLLSFLIGAYYAFFNKQNTTADYLLGNKEMKVWPTAISLTAVSDTISQAT